jgi:hypothetical protein
MDIADMTSLFLGPEDELPQLADHSVLETADTFQIPDRNGSQNVKGELAEIWGNSRSYGEFEKNENGGGMHEFMPDSDKSDFVGEDMEKEASQLLVRAKRALMRGSKVGAVLSEIRSRIPKDSKFREHFAAMASELQESLGLLGTVYIDPSAFSSCAEGAKFVANSSLNPSFVLELEDCKTCAYKVGGQCILFQKRVESSVPWDKSLVAKVAAELGYSDVDLKQWEGLDCKNKIRAMVLHKEMAAPLREYFGSQKMAPVTLNEKVVKDWSSTVIVALRKGLKVLKIADKLLSETGSVAETTAVMRKALLEVGSVAEEQLPCPICEVKENSVEGKRLLAYLPQRLVVIPGQGCLRCLGPGQGLGLGRGLGLQYWGRPMLAPGMAPGMGGGIQLPVVLPEGDMAQDSRSMSNILTVKEPLPKEILDMDAPTSDSSVESDASLDLSLAMEQED